MSGTGDRAAVQGLSDSGHDELNMNPNSGDLPDPQAGRFEASPSVTANVWWSEWANDELRLQQLRPTNLLEDPSQSSLHRTETSGGLGAVEGSERAEGQQPLLETRASSGNGSFEAEMTAAATELVRQTSVGNYQLDLAERFLLENSGARRQEPAYFQIGTPRSTPEGSSVFGAMGENNRQDEAHFEGSVNRTGPSTGGQRPDESHLVNHRVQGMGLQAENHQVGMQMQNDGQQSLVQGLTVDSLRNLPASEMYSRLGAQVENQPLLQHLLQRLERAEARSRSTGSFQSVVDAVGHVQSRQDSERPHAGMCLTPANPQNVRLYGLGGLPGVPGQLSLPPLPTPFNQMQQHSLELAGAGEALGSNQGHMQMIQGCAADTLRYETSRLSRYRGQPEGYEGLPLQSGSVPQQPSQPRHLMTELESQRGNGLQQLQPQPSQSLQLQPQPSQSLQLQPQPSQSLQLQPQPSQSLQLQPQPSQVVQLQPQSIQFPQSQSQLSPFQHSQAPYSQRDSVPVSHSTLLRQDTVQSPGNSSSGRGPPVQYRPGPQQPPSQQLNPIPGTSIPFLGPQTQISQPVPQILQGFPGLAAVPGEKVLSAALGGIHAEDFAAWIGEDRYKHERIPSVSSGQGEKAQTLHRTPVSIYWT